MNKMTMHYFGRCPDTEIVSFTRKTPH